MCCSLMLGSNWSSHSTLLPLLSHVTSATIGFCQATPHYAHCLFSHLNSVNGPVYFATLQQRRTQESRVVLMGQIYSDEDKCGLFRVPSKAGNGKSVPRRNHVLLGVEGLCSTGRSCQTLIRDSYSHLRLYVCTILCPVCVTVL